MIQFTPVTDRHEIEVLFSGLLDKKGQSFAFIALENEKSIGSLCCVLAENSCEILEIQAQDLLVAEGLLRSALNFAANRGAYVAFCSLKGYETMLLSLQFTEENGKFCGEIPTILTCSSCRRKVLGNRETP